MTIMGLLSCPLKIINSENYQEIDHYSINFVNMLRLNKIIKILSNYMKFFLCVFQIFKFQNNKTIYNKIN